MNIRHRNLCVFLILPLILSISILAQAGELEDGFQNPPFEARPWAYWCWMNGNFNYSQMTKELEEIKHMGMGGFSIFDIGAQDPKGIVPAGPAFMGPASVDGIGYAVREAGRLGLGISLIISSSWDAGGDWIPAELGAMGLFTSTMQVKGPQQFSGELPFPDVSKEQKDKGYINFTGPDGLPKFYKNVAVLAVPAGGDSSVMSRDKIIDLSDRLGDRGQLTWDVPEGDWTIVRYVCTNTGEALKLPSPNSNGLILDHFDSEATKFHVNTIVDRLKEELGDLSTTALQYLYLCSYEVRGMIWTPAFVEEFKRRRGYDMTPYLPALFGRTVQSDEITERFLFDYKKTLSDLIIEYHYTNAREIAHANGLELCSESGGPGPPLHNCPVEALRALGALDIPRGEFWNKHQRLEEDGIDLLQLVKEIACASHIYGKRIVQGESFTSFEQWQEGPFELKPLADRAMCEGLNHFVFHTFAHSPPEAGVPGWVYHAGTQFNTTRVWWPKAKPFVDYLSRCSHMLQRGLFVGDVCYYYGDRAPNFVRPKHVDPSLGYGYDYDVTNSEVILERMQVKDGRIVLPDGMSYALLKLPEQDAMPLEVLQKIGQLAADGATIVGPKPKRAHSLHDYKTQDAKVRELADKIWGGCDGTTVLESSYGKGKIVWGKTLREILAERSIQPDFEVANQDQEDTIDYIHRRDGESDFYFVVNRTAEWQTVRCSFRVDGKVPEFWDPASGTMQKQYLYQTKSGRTTVPMKLAPYGSVFVVFQDEYDGPYFHTVLDINSNPSERDRLPFQPATKNQNNQIAVSIPASGGYMVEDNRGNRKAISVPALPSPVKLSGPWDVWFPHGWGVPTSLEFPELISWTEHELDAVKYFSGIAAYHKTFELTEELIQDDYNLKLNLGRVKELADVYLNGHHIGILWKEPFEADITEAAQAGTNRLIVEVANVWNNRLVGDAKLPPEERRTNTNITKGPNLTGVPWKDVPLLDAGLLGPVTIYVSRNVVLSE